MVRADMLDKLDRIAQHIKKSALPFGGIQLLFCGDFFQLPPVTRFIDCSACGTRLQASDKKSGVSSVTCGDCGHKMEILAFQSAAWKAAELACIELQTVFRQTDADFVSILNEIRKGNVTSKAMKLLDQCRVPLATRTNSFLGVLPTKLHVTRAQVADENRSLFNKLPALHLSTMPLMVPIAYQIK
ncbi:hypothetical protein BDF19DRAFT_203565 [Syncephalis fuscata]|nr:hypothetical protein BDF19DRAFT_203565 [Syncephalis fuscata]